MTPEVALAGRMAAVQRTLSEVYRLELGLEAADFVVPAETARSWLPEEGPRSGVLVLEEAGDLWLGVYLDARDREDPQAVAEETSHWVRLVWNAHQETGVSCLQLELQGEVDQYVVARMAGRDPLAHFEGVAWQDWMDPATRDRYETAHRAARRYCRSLERRYPRPVDTPGLVRELRGFYRADPEERLRAGA